MDDQISPETMNGVWHWKKVASLVSLMTPPGHGSWKEKFICESSTEVSLDVKNKIPVIE